MRKKWHKILPVILAFSLLVGVLPISTREGFFALAGESYQDEIDAAKKKKQDWNRHKKN